MRINKFIAANSQFSRRKADELIQDGKVSINGKPVKTPGVEVNPAKDTITVFNKKITPQTETDKVYFALNKPQGYVTTRSDEFDRPTVMSLLPNIPNLKPVGRLDQSSEGLLLLSNDGDFINRLTHPKFECEKTYFAILEGKLSEKAKNQFATGIILDGKKTSPAEISIVRQQEKETVCIVTIHEGRNRQIRKMFAYLKHPVKYLQRTSIGTIKLGSLKKGEYRKLTTAEINAH